MSAAARSVRHEEPRDREAVLRVHAQAFGRPAEARLVEALRDTVAPQLSLVALIGGEVVGHVLLSPVRVAGSPAGPFAGLAPLGVLPAHQGRGVGGALVREALARAPAQGYRAVFLLGDPRYYARFGFTPAAPRGLHYESEAFDAGFQVLELEAGALDGVCGQVQYPKAFAEL